MYTANVVKGDVATTNQKHIINNRAAANTYWDCNSGNKQHNTRHTHTQSTKRHTKNTAMVAIQYTQLAAHIGLYYLYIYICTIHILHCHNSQRHCYTWWYLYSINKLLALVCTIKCNCNNACFCITGPMPG